MTIENTLNKIASHLDNFNKQEDKNKLLTTCTKLLLQLSEDENITPELLERITQLQERINILENNLHSNLEQNIGSGEEQAKSEAKEDDEIDDWDILEEDELNHDWIELNNAKNETPNAYPSTAPSSIPSFAPSSVPSSTPSVTEQIISSSHIGLAGATFGSSFNNLFPGKHFQQDPDGDGGIY